MLIWAGVSSQHGAQLHGDVGSVLESAYPGLLTSDTAQPWCGQTLSSSAACGCIICYPGSVLCSVPCCLLVTNCLTLVKEESICKWSKSIMSAKAYFCLLHSLQHSVGGCSCSFLFKASEIKRRQCYSSPDWLHTRQWGIRPCPMGWLGTCDGTKEHRACWEVVEECTGERDLKQVQLCLSAFGEMPLMCYHPTVPKHCLGGIKVACAETMSRIVLTREGFKWSWVCTQACALLRLIY